MVALREILCRRHVSGLLNFVQRNTLNEKHFPNFSCRRSLASSQRRLCEASDKPSGKKVIFSGIQPTGVLHLGNYFGAVKQWVDLQNRNEDVIYCIVDLHAITLEHDTSNLRKNILTMAASLIACGIDPNKAILFQQSQVAEHSQLNWVLNSLATMARLKRQPQFKEKSRSLKDVPVALFTYPILQAADILLYNATHVPVGKDQEQHIQISSELATRFNFYFGETFNKPACLEIDENLAKIRSLRKPDHKMSKSEPDPKSRIEFLDDPSIIKEKIRKAVTDFTSEVYYDVENRPGVSNLITIHSAITGKSFKQIRDENSLVDTGKYKSVLADVVVEFLTPIQNRVKNLIADEDHLKHLLNIGNEKARTRASKTWKTVCEKVNFTL